MVIVDATRQLLREHGSSLFAAEGQIDPHNVTDVGTLFQRLQQAGLGRNDAIRCLDQFVSRGTLTEAVTRADRFAQEAAQAAQRLAALEQQAAPAAQPAAAQAGQTLRTVGEIAPQRVNDLGQAVRTAEGEATLIDGETVRVARQTRSGMDGLRQSAGQAFDSLRQAGTQTIQTLRNNWQTVVATTTATIRASQMTAAATGSTATAGALGTLATGTVGLNLPTAAVVVGGLSIGGGVTHGMDQAWGSPISLIRAGVDLARTGSIDQNNINLGLTEHVTDFVYWVTH